MKTLLTSTILILTTFGCVYKQTPKVEKLPMAETRENTNTTFRQVTDFPTIKDTVTSPNLGQVVNIQMQI